ncbi:MAG: LamB/YcsF family protein [Chloroflexota bacterium]|nr:LamB/YcsF family protein [Chloroflexota bacterium]
MRLVTEGRLTTIDGQELRLEVDSICIHSDTPTAAAIAVAIRRQFTAAGITVRALRDR